MEIAKETPKASKETSAQNISDNKQSTAINTESVGSLRRAVINPRTATPDTILQLQRIYGNKTVSQLIQRSTIQRHAGHSHDEEDNAVERQLDNHVCSASCQHGTAKTTNQSKQTASTTRAASPNIQRTFAGKGVIQRHASFEHKMLGDVDPNDLKILASAKNLENDGQMLKKGDVAQDYQIGQETFELKVGKGENKGKPITRMDVIHIIDQELRRLSYFKAAPFGLRRKGTATGTRKDYEKSLKKIDSQGLKFGGNKFNEELEKKDVEQIVEEVPQQDEQPKNEEQQQHEQPKNEAPKEKESNEWQVRLVELPSKKDEEGNEYEPLLVTYGEMNTLADIYGNPEELLNADPMNRYKIIQGIRNQALVKYFQLRDQITGREDSKDTSRDFKDAIGNTGRLNDASLSLGFMSGAVLSPEQQGELNLMGQTGEGKKVSKKEDDYSAGLARNACHFAPESWFNWRDYHKKARDLAIQSHQAREKKDNALADDLENQAMIQNGFGDHFLQDSYASGHLINKTQIMQWFVQWLDSKWYRSSHTSAKDWEAAQVMANEQSGLGIAKNQSGGLEDDRYDVTKIEDHAAKDPQAVENMTGDWTQRFDALGLKIPDSLKPGSLQFDFLINWQKVAAEKQNPQMTVQQFVDNKIGASVGIVKNNVNTLKQEGLVVVGTTGVFIRDDVYSLKGEYVPKDKNKFNQLTLNINNTGNSQEDQQKKQSSSEDYEKATKRAIYDNYHRFLNNAVIQSSTNQLHDYFCNNGLEVITGTGENIGRIYGDYKMLEKDSAKGVQYSGETAQMSRQAIFDLVKHGDEGKVPSVQEIALRFPSQANGKNGYVRLDKWHEELKKLCEDKIFDESKNSLKDLASMAKGSKLTEVVSKDQHGDGSEF